jgi:urease subunit alpha
MFGAYGRALSSTCVTFVSQAALADGIGERLRLQRRLVAVSGMRQLRKSDMIHNGYTPQITVDAQNYRVHADGILLACEPASVLPMAQRYFLF